MRRFRDGGGGARLRLGMSRIGRVRFGERRGRRDDRRPERARSLDERGRRQRRVTACRGRTRGRRARMQYKSARESDHERARAKRSETHEHTPSAYCRHRAGAEGLSDNCSLRGGAASARLCGRLHRDGNGPRRHRRFHDRRPQNDCRLHDRGLVPRSEGSWP
jgi:hypothetical protein